MGTARQRAFSEPGIGESLAGKRAIEARIWPRVQITPEGGFLNTVGKSGCSRYRASKAMLCDEWAAYAVKLGWYRGLSDYNPSQ